MINLGINEFIRNIKKNIFVIVQMVIVYVIAILMVSASVEQLKLLSGVSNFFDSTGIVINSGSIKSNAPWPSEENLKRDLKKVEQVVTLKQTGFGGTIMNFIAYDDNNVTYSVPLISGEWFDDAKKKEGYTNIVVSDNVFPNINVGDDLEFDGYKFHITGIFSSSEMVCGLSMFSSKGEGVSPSYLSYYSTPDSLYNERTGEPCCVAICSRDDMMKNIDNERIWDLNMITIDYEDDITDEEMDNNKLVLAEEYGLIDGTVYDCRDLYDYSIKLLNIKLLPVATVFILMLLLIFISLINSSAISVNYEKRNYGIYFIAGNNWKNTIILSLVHWGCVALTSLILAISACLIIKSSGKFDSLTLSFSGYHVLAIVAVTVLMLFMALILPYRMLRKLQPVTILKNNDK